MEQEKISMDEPNPQIPSLPLQVITTNPLQDYTYQPKVHSRASGTGSASGGDNKGPKKCIAIMFLIWNTFDFITDIILAVEWHHGVKATDDMEEKCEDNLKSINDQLQTAATVLIVCSVIGYLLYLFDAYRQSDAKCNCAKIMKLVLEDLLSMSIVIYISATVYSSGWTSWTILSFMASVLSFFFAMMKQACFNPCAHGTGCGGKCAGFCGCVLILGIAVGFVTFAGLMAFASIFKSSCEDDMEMKLDIIAALFN